METTGKNDGELLTAYVDGQDSAAFGDLHQKYAGMVYSICLRFLGNREDAEDAAAACFVVLLKKAASLKNRPNLGGWLHWCAARTAKNALVVRTHRAEREQEAHDMQMANRTNEKAQGEELLPHLEARMAEMPDRMRDVLVMHFYQGLSRSEIAEKLRCPEGSIGTWIARGVDRLRGSLKRVAVDVGDEELSSALSRFAVMVPVPAGLVAQLEGLAEGKALAGPIMALADRMIRAIFWSQVKTAVAVAAGIAVIGGGAFAAVHAARSGSTGLTAGGNEGKGANAAEEPAKSLGTAAAAPEEKKAEKKSKFDTPIWDPGAEWEAAGPFLAPPCGTSVAWLDGPRDEILVKGDEDRCAWSWLDEKTDQFHTVAGTGSFGYLDGPFSRARRGGWDFTHRSAGANSPDRRYSAFTDPFFGQVLRCLDFKKQEVRTLHGEGNQSISGVFGLTFSKSGQLYVLTPPNRLLVLNPENDQVMKTLTLEMRPAEGVRLAGWTFSLALDEKHNRLYTSGNYETANKWRVWYWDLEANGAFHGEAPAVDKMPASYTGKAVGSYCAVQTGSYKDGWNAYAEGSVYFGPDDPDYRFLYSARTDTSNFFRLDLEKKELAAFSGPAPGSKTCKFVGGGGTTYGFQSHVAANWLENGDFTIPVGGSHKRGVYLYRRVK